MSNGFNTDTDINAYDCDGFRPVHHAILAGDLARAKSLVAQGAMLNAPTESGDGALVLLCRALRDSESAKWIEPLMEMGAEIIDRDRLGWSALHHAVQRGSLQTVERLMEHGADPFLKANDGKRPIDLVDGSAATEVVQRLKTALNPVNRS